ncbi:hypothetical protein WMY93_002189 [Mugilogobius chulae]|uniref:Uncharacterized protein n=1 Tax=Mugilogobius chulae TaxID=88201 RepID=A0AAW0PUH6_9GOBI
MLPGSGQDSSSSVLGVLQLFYSSFGWASEQAVIQPTGDKCTDKSLQVCSGRARRSVFEDVVIQPLTIGPIKYQGN